MEHTPFWHIIVIMLCSIVLWWVGARERDHHWSRKCWYQVSGNLTDFEKIHSVQFYNSSWIILQGNLLYVLCILPSWLAIKIVFSFKQLPFLVTICFGRDRRYIHNKELCLVSLTTTILCCEVNWLVRLGIVITTITEREIAITVVISSSPISSFIWTLWGCGKHAWGRAWSD